MELKMVESLYGYIKQPVLFLWSQLIRPFLVLIWVLDPIIDWHFSPGEAPIPGFEYNVADEDEPCDVPHPPKANGSHKQPQATKNQNQQAASQAGKKKKGQLSVSEICSLLQSFETPEVMSGIEAMLSRPWNHPPSRRTSLDDEATGTSGSSEPKGEDGEMSDVEKVMRAVASANGRAVLRCCIARFMAGGYDKESPTTGGYTTNGYLTTLRHHAAQVLIPMSQLKAVGKAMLEIDENLLDAFCRLVDSRNSLPAIRPVAVFQGLGAVSNLAAVSRRVRDEIRERQLLAHMAEYEHNPALLEQCDDKTCAKFYVECMAALSQLAMYRDLGAWFVAEGGLSAMLFMLEMLVEEGHKTNPGEVMRVVQAVGALSHNPEAQPLINTPAHVKRLVSLRAVFEEVGPHLLPQMLHSLNNTAQLEVERQRQAQLAEALWRASAAAPPADPLKQCARPLCGVSADRGVKLMRCTGCQVVAYCSRDCQRLHWKAGHKAACGDKHKTKTS